VFVSKTQYDNLMELCYKGQYRNVSACVDEIIYQYINLIARHQELVNEIARLKRELKEAQDKILSYRGQIVDNVR
jgi:hypothetical protein